MKNYRNTRVLLASLGLAAMVATVPVAFAQPVPPGPAADAGVRPMRGPHGPGGPHHGHPPGFAEPGAFSLLTPQADRKLTVADTQKVAEAFLLWNGNRDWKVTDAAEGPDNTVRFALATATGSVIAKFSMDRATGQVKRLG